MKKSILKTRFILFYFLFQCGIISTSSAQLVSLPYSTDFESGTIGWSTSSVDTLTKWEYGTPNFGVTIGSHSGSNCWDINLDSGYYTSAISMLYSPIFDLTGISAPRISFWLNYFVENKWDGTRLDYSIDNGASWIIVGTVNDINSQNWYNDSSLNSTLLPGWTNQTNGWKKSTYLLYQVQGFTQVQFRFTFTSDNSQNDDGISMDDFEIREIPPYDAALTNIETGSSGYLLGSTTDPITLTMRNIGGLNISNFTYEYSVNGIQQISATNLGIVPPGNTIQLILPGFNITQISNNVCGKITLVNDGDTSNNSLCFQLAGMPILTPIYSDNFDSGNLGWFNENISGVLTNWELGQPNYGTTNTSYSPPFAWDINLNSPYTINAHCNLYTPIFDLSTSIHPKLSFWQNRNTTMGYVGTYIEYKSSANPNWNFLGKFNDNNATNWYSNSNLWSINKPAWDGNSLGWIKSVYNLDSVYIIGPVQFRFVFTSYTFTTGDGMTIDNFLMSRLHSNDALLSSFVTPTQFVNEGVLNPLQVILFNNGTLPLTTLTIKYRLNGGAPVSFNWNGNLLTDSSALITLPSFIPNIGSNTISAYIEWPADLNQDNDTISISPFGLVNSGLPYSNDFETNGGGWYPSQVNNNNTVWMYGTPNLTTLNTAHSGFKCWGINLNTPYFNLADALLTSPIFDITPYNIITIQFWLNLSSESGADGMFIEYTTNGTTWQRLGSIGDPAGTNWYNSTLTLGNQGWSGISGGWQSCSYVYTGPWGINYFRFRLRFISDFNVVDAGISFDDISITGVTSVEDINENSNVIVYPNPSNDELFILVLDNASPLKQIELRSIDGKVVYTQDRPSSKQIKISTASFSAGVYLLGLTNENGDRSFKRIVVQH